MQTVFHFLLRTVLLAAGLVFAASLALLALALLALWSVRALWCKLTGQPINPFVVRMNPTTGFGHVFGTRTGRSASTSKAEQSRRKPAIDVTDVVAKDVTETKL